MKTKIYKTHYEENKLIIDDLFNFYNKNGFIITGAFAILQHDYLENEYGLYRSHRTCPDENGQIIMTFDPIYDKDGNHILLQDVKETPVVFANMSVDRVSHVHTCYLIFY